MICRYLLYSILNGGISCSVCLPVNGRFSSGTYLTFANRVGDGSRSGLELRENENFESRVTFSEATKWLHASGMVQGNANIFDTMR